MLFGLAMFGMGIASPASLSGQEPAPPVAAVRVDSIVARALAAENLAEMAFGLIDSIGGRLSGTREGVRAERWAAHWLREAGFDSVWYELVEMPVWVRGELEIRVVIPATLMSRPVHGVAYGYSPGAELNSLHVIDVGRGDLTVLAAAGESANGAAILTDVVSPELIEAAAAAGASAVMRVSIEPGRLPQARVAPVSDPPAPLPIVSLANEDGLWLRRLAARTTTVLNLRLTAATRPGTAANVVGELRGSEPAVADEPVILGAHLDSWDLGDGALDNGTGVLSVMTAAAALAGAETPPRRTVRVVFFAGEELGLLGSRAYVKAHTDSLANVVAMLNMDMVGVPQGFGATGHTEADTLFARVARSVALRPLDLSTDVDHGGGPGSDHQPFLLAGVPTVYVKTALSPDALRWYHDAGDTLDKIDFGAVRATAAAAAALAWELADHPGRPLRQLTPDETQQLIQRLGWVN